MVIYPAERVTDLVLGMRASKLEPKRLRLIHPKLKSGAILAIAEGVKYGNPGLKVDPPVIIYKPEGGYTDEAIEMIGE